jgi:peroxiredoxin Q/BCP
VQKRPIFACGLNSKKPIRRLGISAAAVPALDRFHDAQGLGLPLLGDESKTMLQAYGVWAKKHLYGRTFMGIVRPQASYRPRTLTGR